MKYVREIMGHNRIYARQKKRRNLTMSLKMGRVHLQNAVPIRLGEGFEASSRVLARDIRRSK
ncbi:hypothetical protein GCM10020331_095600 [Ectobacillus funiculus]